MEDKSKIELIIEHVNDVIDETPVDSCATKDIDIAVNELVGHRNTLRQYRKHLMDNETQDEKFIVLLTTTLDSIKDYFKKAKEWSFKLEQLRIKRANQDDDAKITSMKFTVTDLNRKIEEINEKLTVELETKTDVQLIQMEKDSSNMNSDIKEVSNKYEQLLQTHVTDKALVTEITGVGKSYAKLTKSFSNYLKLLKTEIDNRDIYKQRSFDESKLNIKLDKFAGYTSETDIYTFQSTFNKIHLQTTPSKLLPDLLKNNFLRGSALSLVKNIPDIDEIWKALKAAYGDTRCLLTKKLQMLSDKDPLYRIKDPEKLIQAITSIINIIKELMRLAEEHHLEESLLYGDGLNRIYDLIGDNRLTRWLSSISDEVLSPKTTWLRLINFLEKEQRLQQQKLVIHASNSQNKKTGQPPKDKSGSRHGGYSADTSKQLLCSICDTPDGLDDHVSTNGPGHTRLLQYFTCKRFAELTPANRLALLKKKGYCYQCLYPGADASSGRHKNGQCQRHFTCSHPSHQRNQVRKHVLVCEEHKSTPDNQDLLEKFKQRCMKNSQLPTHAKEICIAFHASFLSNHETSPKEDSVNERGIYLLQTILVNDQRINIFYDNGCSDLIIKESAIAKLGNHATQTSSRPIKIGGVGESTTLSTLGTYSLQLPLCDGDQALVSGICIKSITATFPHYPLDQVMEDIQQSFSSSGISDVTLPKPAHVVGGDTHLMLGVKYLRYHPKLVYQLPSGLSIYQSAFKNADGGRGVIGGPHHIFTKIHQSFFSHNQMLSFFNHQYLIARGGVQIDPDVKMLSLLSKDKRFELSESTGSEITYRCIKCRSCSTCKSSDHQQDISIREEAEQELINQSVKLDLNTNTVTATLPLLQDPSIRLSPNKDIAMKVYQQQLKKLNKVENQQDKQDIIASEKKLQDLGFVDYVHNLPADQQQMLKSSTVQNFIPWRAVWKLSSVSTPCRIVFDASQPTQSGFSLNDLLAKGTNNLNKLQEMMIRWPIHKVGLHTDVSKMYNTVKLDPTHWTLQRYIWQDELNPSMIPREKVIKTLIYGIRSSGNQAERGLRQIAETFKDQYPAANRILQEDVYVDDCISGDINNVETHKRADEIEVITSKGGYKLKGITLSGADPPSHLTDDEVSVTVGGMKWYSKSDEVSIAISELNFSPKRRGKKSSAASNIIPEVLTRRHCASKVAEVFDITGKLSPLIAAMKFDLRELSNLQLSWEDAIPDSLRPIWISHFEMMQELGNLKFKRAIVPIDAVSLDIETLDFGDASKTLICVCIYVRFLRKNGQFSCQLSFSRTKLVPKDMTLPRAELYASLVATHTGEVVQRSLKRYFKSATKFTDSQISLYWISNDQKVLRQWVRSRVIEINRFTSKDDWLHVKSSDMIADIGTRKGATLNDVNQQSSWINGFDWMKREKSQFPAKRVEEITLSNKELSEVNKETQICKNIEVHVSLKSDEIKKRYEFSSYLLDPNRHSFHQVIRIMAYVFRYCNNLRKSKPKLHGELSEEELSSAEQYYFQKGTSEVKKFTNKSKYENITREQNGTLKYTGRILPDQSISIVGRFTTIMKDLSSSTFCVPVLDRHSPISYSLVMDIHWNHSTAQHSGVETTHRFVLQKAYIIEGRNLVKQVRDSCQRCRYLMKRTVDISMGPVPPCNITIAPAFYYSQIDLSGPYLAYQPQNKRKTIKIWLVVFCCCSTSAVPIKTMDDYSATSFMMAFTRFACDRGFPKKLLCDEGSQLVKACKEMNLNLRDVQSNLMKRHKVEFQVCPVQGHYMHGKVERKIREINASIEKVAHNEKLSLLQWETLSATMANTINNLPLALGNIVGDFECMDLITPNRLLLGRNNDRSPEGNVIYTDNPSRILQTNEQIYQSWFEIWLITHVPKLMKQQKWYQTDNINVGDVVIFTKLDSAISKDYTYGQVTNLEYSGDGVARKATIRYKNATEDVFRETKRAVRGLVIIHHVDESDVMTQLGQMALHVDLAYLK